ncbi:MAG: DUF4159 domain-containing protein, partial [Deltaproteobacteria bacterium]|nr:DUF4159 domain-containing protein [Deltaproteobacteria bacterium]
SLTGLALAGLPEPLPTARRRLAWEVHRRTSVETDPTPRRVHPLDADFFDSPLLYLAGEQAFDPLSDAEVAALRRFLSLGGMLIVDDSSGGQSDLFDASVRRMLGRVLPEEPLAPLPATHSIYHSFYLLDRPVGRVRGPRVLEAVLREGRAVVVYSRHDLGGAWARDNLGNWRRSVTPGGANQRERAVRLGVNLVLYALCLDYKDDQVHAPFLMRRRGHGRTP